MCLSVAVNISSTNMEIFFQSLRVKVELKLCFLNNEYTSKIWVFNDGMILMVWKSVSDCLFL
jgi:hypothetical protein